MPRSGYVYVEDLTCRLPLRLCQQDLCFMRDSSLVRPHIHQVFILIAHIFSGFLGVTHPLG